MNDLLLTAVKSTSLYLLVLLCLRLIGKKGISEMSVMDLVLLILIGSHIAPQLPEGNKWAGAIVSIITLSLLSYTLNYFSYKFQKAQKILEGTPVILVSNGRIYHNNMRKELINMDNLKEAMHHSGIEDLSDVKAAILETDGEISIIKKQ